MDNLLKVTRILTLNELTLYWPAFKQGFDTLRKVFNTEIEEQKALKELSQALLREDKTWVGVVFDGDHNIVGWAVAEVICEPFSTQEVFGCKWLWHQSHDASRQLLHSFERFAKEQNIHKYYILTRAFSGSRTQCLKKHGFNRSFVMYQKTS